MKAEELMKGDWVYLFDTPCQVKDIIEDGVINYEKDVTPIPLTPEILEKNGFKKLKYNGCGWILDTKEHNLFHDSLEITIELYGRLAKFNYTLSDYIPEEGYECWCGGDMDIDRRPFVHDLQHFYKLIGFNKEIVL